MDYIDMHCDTLMKAFLSCKKTIGSMKGMVDVPKLVAGGCKAQFFAIFLPPLSIKRKIGFLLPSDDNYIDKLIRIMHNTIAAHPNTVALACSSDDIARNCAQGKLSAVLTLEDGRVVDGSIEKLDQLYKKGIRLISLTWNAHNCFGAPNSYEPEVMQDGLTTFGKEAVVRMNELGMLVDVSHLSDGGFYDVARFSTKPFVASHSNCRALSPHRRNLSDDMLRTLGEAGGVAGINFGGEFLNSDITLKQSRVECMVAHMKHMSKMGGIDCVAIGTDFDGISGEFEIGSASRMPLLFETMDKAGFTSNEIEKIAHGNAERVIRATMF